MNMDDYSAEFFRRREAQERELAEKAHSEEIKAMYLALAENYKLAAEEAEREEQQKRPATA